MIAGEHRAPRTAGSSNVGIAAALLVGVALALWPRAAAAEDAVTLSVTIKDHNFDPTELHAPANTPIDIKIKNAGDIVMEFESSDLHFEKIVPVGREGVVHVRPQQPGRYNFFDDFHHETQGYLIVP
jgi:heme/copper-type cytochrome/quinol oxidase subunit 2